MSTLRAGQPETNPSAEVSNEKLLEVMDPLWTQADGNAAALMSENRALKAEVNRLARLVAESNVRIIYTSAKKKVMLVKIGFTEDWERRRKVHERNGWEIASTLNDSRKTEARFKQQLRTEGFKSVGGRGLEEVYPLTEQ